MHLRFAPTPWAKGKIERLILTVQAAIFAQVRDLIERGEVTDLPGLNQVLHLWLDQVYHRRTHSQTGATPAERLPEPVRPVRDVAAHEQTFLWQATRTVRRAGCTVSLFGNTYALGDPGLAGARVQLRYNPYRLQTVAVWHQGQYRQTVTSGELRRERHPHVSRLPERGTVSTPTALNHLSALRRRAAGEPPQNPVAFAGALPPARLADLLREVLGRPLEDRELQACRRHWRRYGPFDPQAYRPALERLVQEKGPAHHVSVYLDVCRPEGDV